MKRLSAILVVVIAALFFAGLWHLLHLRFQSGDVYPKYSTLRADPLGTKALFESLGRLLNVRRHFKPHLEAGQGLGATLFVLGTDGTDATYAPEDFEELENFAAAGGRVVVALQPQFAPGRFAGLERVSATNRPPTQDGKKKPPSARKAARGRPATPREVEAVSMAERWKFQIKYTRPPRDEKGVYQPVKASRTAELPAPASLPWHTAVWFDQPDPVWRVVYARDHDHALAMERNLGAGTLVLLSDSYLFSNEALRREAQPQWLAWLVGPNHTVLFDETHLGMEESTGLATLARKYRLEGLGLALLLLAGLFVWKNAVRFLPLPETAPGQDDADHVLGRESAAGFVNLLRRNVRRADTLAVCFAEWNKACGRTTPPAKLLQLQNIVQAEQTRPARDRNVVGAYQRCCEVLKKSPEFRSDKTRRAEDRR